MHSIRPTNLKEPQGQWEVIFICPGGHVQGIDIYETKDEAMGFCAYLNGGLDPRGYHMEVTNHY